MEKAEEEWISERVEYSSYVHLVIFIDSYKF